MDAAGGTISLVVNADEFGLSAEVSRGILQAHREGIVTSTSMLGNCPDLDAGPGAAGQAPRLGVGVQLTLVRGRPVADPGSRALAARGRRRLPPAGPRRVRRLAGRAACSPARSSASSRPRCSAPWQAGLRPDHLNTQHHIGFIPPVGLAVEAVARRHGIPGLRSAVEEPTLTWLTELPRGAVAAAAGRAGLAHPAAAGRAPPRPADLGLRRERPARRGAHPGDRRPPGPGQPRAHLPPRRGGRPRARAGRLPRGPLPPGARAEGAHLPHYATCARAAAESACAAGRICSEGARLSRSRRI